MKQLILYSQPDCPPCEVVKMFLKEHGISFTEKNIKKDLKARDELIHQFQSYSTPTIVIDNEKVITGFNLKELEEALLS